MHGFASNIKHRVKNIRYVNKIAGVLLREYYWIMSSFPRRGSVPKFASDSYLLVDRYCAIDDYLKEKSNTADERRKKVELSLLPVKQVPFSVSGYCALCEKNSNFFCDFLYHYTIDGQTIPNWRETLLCKSCGQRNRMRGCLHVFIQEFNPSVDADIYITEQLTLTYRWLRGRYSKVKGSEYISDNLQPGTIVRGVRHENIEGTSFKDEQFDYVLSFDILEHVGDIEKSIAEIFRILAPNGRLFFTAPTNIESPHMLVRATIDEKGNIRHIESPEYHGNPVDPSGGSLCFRHFGWDILDLLRQYGFENCEFLVWWSRELGYLQYPQLAITAVRPSK